MSNYARRPRRILAGVLAGAMALSVTPILGLTGIASAQTVADPIGAGNVCEDVPQSEPFTDVQTTDPSYGEIVCLVATEITTGVTATTYEPNSFVTRRQMALFLVRAANEANRLEIGDKVNELPAPKDTTFTDTNAETQSIEDAISQVSQAGIAAGFPDNTYRPAAPVSRRQMAAFIDRLYSFLTGTDLPATSDHFADDSADSADAQGSTNAVAEAGIFVGNEDGTFRPAQEITRRQMASVITRTLQVLMEKGFINAWFDADRPQAFNVTPAGPVEKTTSTDGTTNEGAQTYTFTGVTGTNLKVDLLPCSNVNNGVFTDADGTANVADGLGDSSTNFAAIEQVNGAAPTGTVSAVNGAVSVVVDSTDFDCAYVVLFNDANGNGIDLDANNRPSEPYALAGPTSWVYPEAATGDYPYGDLLFFDTARNMLVLDGGYTVFYDTNDGFFYNHDFTVTEAEFESYLSIGDNIDTEDNAYSREDTGISQFNIHDNTANAPTNVAATVGDFDANAADTAANDVRVTFAASTGGRIVGYTADLFADDGNAATPCDTSTTVIGTANSVGTATSVTITDVTPAGKYCAVVYANTLSGGESDYSAGVNVTIAGPALVPVTLKDAKVSLDALPGGLVTVGDQATVVFSKLTAITGTDVRIDLVDADGDRITVLINGAAPVANDGFTSASYTSGVNGAGEETIVVTLLEAPEDRNVAGNGDISYPLTITAISGLEGADGAPISLATSADVIVDVEP